MAHNGEIAKNPKRHGIHLPTVTTEQVLEAHRTSLLDVAQQLVVRQQLRVLVFLHSVRGIIGITTRSRQAATGQIIFARH
jgi:hypothetical protein